ncbi:MAG: surface layer protein [Oscillospiraceae bacterium]|nr:surface layer protein [Oscillospiraceae bacterium]
MKRIRRMLALLLPLALLLSAAAWATDGGGSDSADSAETGAILPRVRSYDAAFDDVTEEDWFFPYIAAGYECALFEGRGARCFDPAAAITVAELATLSARIRAAWDGEVITDTQPWSAAPYVDYLRGRDAFDERLTPYLDTQATRAQLAALFAATLPEQCFDARNDALVEDALASGDFITDVDDGTPHREQIFWMYRQGLLVGMDERGSYCPAQSTSRAEVAAVVMRIVEPALRLTPDWVVLPRWSAVGTTLPDLVPMPESVDTAPAYADDAAIDALVRHMLALGEHTLTLRYPVALSQSDARTIANLFNACVKGYCEQMYNHVSVTRYLNSGRATLVFSAVGCTAEELAAYREATMARAIEVHDMLWQTGQLTEAMSQLERARVCFLWLCEHCDYDYDAPDDASPSHIAYSALVDGKAVCDGYTGAYNLLLKLEGIDCRAVHNSEHIWTEATLDGTTYHIDVTWADRSGQALLRYFAMTPEESYAVHPW